MTPPLSYLLWRLSFPSHTNFCFKKYLKFCVFLCSSFGGQSCQKCGWAGSELYVRSHITESPCFSQNATIMSFFSEFSSFFPFSSLFRLAILENLARFWQNNARGYIVGEDFLLKSCCRSCNITVCRALILWDDHSYSNMQRIGSCRNRTRKDTLFFIIFHCKIIQPIFKKVLYLKFVVFNETVTFLLSWLIRSLFLIRHIYLISPKSWTLFEMKYNGLLTTNESIAWPSGTAHFFTIQLTFHVYLSWEWAEYSTREYFFSYKYNFRKFLSITDFKFIGLNL